MVFLLGGWRMIYRRGQSMKMKAVVNPFKFKKKKKKKKSKNKKKEKKKKSRGSIGDPVIGDDSIVCEILSRLPVESLTRFKCVCKRWRFLIQQDPYFINLHRTRSKTRLLIIVPKSKPKPGISVHYPEQEFFMTADLFEEGGRGRTTSAPPAFNIHTITELYWPAYDNISKPVNGLICLINSFMNFCVRIYNITTGRLTRNIESKLVMREVKKHGKFVEKSRCMGNYQFGFDPATNEHKLVCIWCIHRKDLNRDYFVCEVFTVGNNSWRRIEEVPPYEVADASVYVNVSIYWLSHQLFRLNWDDKNPPFIVAFDIGIEKFRAIPIPNFILDQPRDHYGFVPLGRYVDILEVDGRVALLIRMSGYIVKLWIFDDEHTTNQQNWTTEVTITLPFCWDKDCLVFFHSVVGTTNDQIILRTKTKQESVSFYSYNWKNNSFTEVKISGIPPDVPNLYSATFYDTYVESLLLVQK